MLTKPIMKMEKQDGSWAWAIVIAAASIRIIVYGISYTSGVIYYVILDVFKKSRAETSWIASVITAALFATGPVSGVLVNRFGTRKIALLGGVIASSGLMLSSFATSLPLLALSYGVITGVGCGLTFIPGSVAVARYFTKRRNIAMGIAAAGGGVGTFLFPPIINFLNEEYAWRGMFMILSGISLNICVFAMLYRPVIMQNNNSDKAKDQEDPTTARKMSQRKRNNWTFLKNCDFHIFGINNIMYQLGATMVYGHLGKYALQMDVDDFSASILYSFVGITVTICKFFQGFLIQYPKWRIMQPYYQYILWYTVGGVACICLLVNTGYPGLVVFSFVFGASYAACGGSLIPAILIDMAGVDQFSLTYGIILFEQAIGSLFGPPLTGLLFDTLLSYDSAFVMAGVLMILSGAIMIFPCRKHSSLKSETDSTYEVKYTENVTVISEAENLIEAYNERPQSGQIELTVTKPNSDNNTEEADKLIEQQSVEI